MNPPFHADHVGSLLRPDALRRAFRAHAAGEIDGAAFGAIQDEAIRAAVRMQEELGLRAITDGEFRRASYWSHFVDGIEGLEVAQARFDFTDDSGDRLHFLAPHIAGPLKRKQALSTPEFDFVKAATGRTPKITLPSPPTLHFWDAGGDLDRSFDDIARVFQEEIADLARRGCTYIQLDDVPLAMLCDPDLRTRLTREGEDPEALLGRYVELFNASLAQRPKSMTVALHVCRGNFKGHYLSKGGYDWVAERLFTDIDVDTYFLEFDTPRAGDFGPLRHLPEAKSVVLGLISSKVPELEGRDAVKRRIDEAARFVAADRLALSPQCGFASAVSGNPVTYDDQVAKLRRVVEVANDVWGAA
jgi:5-methyltetrahydropteroyltriglutamate--homocysteine methyltransferase